VSLSVAEGEIFGILGPNGAGKTTTVECAIGLRTADSGSIRLLGLDPRTDRDEIHEVVGVQLQSGGLPGKLRVGEILAEYRSFYREPADVDELIDVLGLGAKRGDTWELIEGIRARGVTIVLVTHFMEEAERLCDRVALIDSGRVVALDTPAALAERSRGGKTVRFLPSAPFDDRLLTRLPGVTGVEHAGQHVVVTGSGELVNAVILTLDAAGVTAHDVQLDSSNLEDAFVKLTGSHLLKEGALA
jgi:ABC-2 type transport system ATP-binding protein